MRETDLGDVFAEFEALVAPTFRAPGPTDVQRRVRDRRRRRLLAGVTALLLASPTGAYAVAGRDGDPPPPAPVPSPSVAPSGTPVERPVTVPGVPGKLRELRFVDARHAWAFFDTCETNEAASTDCQRDLAVTDDGGATWRKVVLPAAADEPGLAGPPYLLPVDERRLTVVLVGRYYLVTTDGGASFTTHPVTAPPTTTQLAMATGSGYLLRCRGDDGVAERSCDRPELARLGEVDPLTQPPVDLDWEAEPQLVEGKDGRLWVAVAEGDRMTVAVSADNAETWQKLPAVTGGRRLLVSPNGSDVWLVGITENAFDVGVEKPVWSLEGDRWRERSGLPDDTAEVAADDGGFLVVASAFGNVGFWTPKGYVDVPEVRGVLRAGTERVDVEVLPDGAVVLRDSDGWIVGVGTGPEQPWTRLS